MVNQEFKCKTRNLSHDGLALLGHGAVVPEGTFMRVQFTLPRNDRPIDVDGVLVRSETDHGGMVWGLKLVTPPSTSLAKIDGYVDAHRPQTRSNSTSAAQLGDLEKPARRASEGVGSDDRPAAPAAEPRRETRSRTDIGVDLDELYERAISRTSGAAPAPRKKSAWIFS